MATTVVAVTVLALVGCGANSSAPDPSGPRPLDEQEAYRLAAFRFKNFDKGVRSIRGTLKEAQENLSVAGWVDFPSETGLVKFIPSQAATNTPPFLVIWTAQNINVLELAGDDTSTDVPTTRPEGAWTPTPFDPKASSLVKSLAVLKMLGADRPENALLVKQGGARWWGAEQIDGQKTDIFSGPRPENETAPPTSAVGESAADDRTKYWITQDTGLLLRFDIRLMSEKDFSSFTFTDPPSAPDFLPTPTVEPPAAPQVP